MKKLLFIPTYNCEKQIERVFARFNIESTGSVDEILVIDNCSQDNTFNNLLQLKKTIEQNVKVTLIQNSENLGFGGSHKKAFKYALENGFDFCIVLHGDDQARLENFNEIIKNLNTENDQFIFGSRFSFRSKTYNYSNLRIVGNLFFNTLASLICFRLIPDLGGSGLNIYRVDLLFKKYDFATLPDDLTFHTKVLFRILNIGAKIQFVPIEWHELDQISNVRIVSQSYNLFKLIFDQIIDRIRRA